MIQAMLFFRYRWSKWKQWREWGREACRGERGRGRGEEGPYSTGQKEKERWWRLKLDGIRSSGKGSINQAWESEKIQPSLQWLVRNPEHSYEAHNSGFQKPFMLWQETESRPNGGSQIFKWPDFISAAKFCFSCGIQLFYHPGATEINLQQHLRWELEPPDGFSGLVSLRKSRIFWSIAVLQQLWQFLETGLISH